MIGDRKQNKAIARNEIAGLLGDAVDPAEGRGDVLAEGDQIDLIVLLDNCAFGVDEEC